MRKFQNRALIFTLMFLCAFLAKSGGKVEAAVDINGYYEGDDGGAYYIRQVGDQIYWFGESPNGDWANVLKGTITGNNIAARWWNVPKGKAKSMGEVALAISDNGASLTRVQLRGEVSLANTLTGYKLKTLKKVVFHTEMVGGQPVVKGLPPEIRSRPQGFSGGEGDLTGVWMGNDYGYYYVRELPDGDVVWVAENGFYGGEGGTAKPAFTHVFFGKKFPAGSAGPRAGEGRNPGIPNLNGPVKDPSIWGEWIDLPKGNSSGKGALTVAIKGPQDMTTVGGSGGFAGTMLWRSLPNSLRGYADLHAHPMVNLGFAGKLINGGVDAGSLMPADSDCNHSVRAKGIKQALGADNYTRGGAGPDNQCGDTIRKEVISAFEDANKAYRAPDWAVGFPTFKDWPRWNDITHQKMWVDWIRRSYDGGQRVMVALAVNNLTIATGVGNVLDEPKDDKGSADLQVKEIISFVGRHSDFMEVAYSPQDLRRIISSNKMAIVVGVEIDNIGNFIRAYPNTAPPDSVVANEIQRLYDEGVRYIFPIHLVNNKFGGTAVYQDVFNLSNYHINGSYWDLVCSKYDENITYKFRTAGFDVALAGVKVLRGFDIDITRNPPDSPKCDALGLGHKNSLALTFSGEKVIREMMKRGMLIDIDHMSQAAANETLGIAESVFNKYPLVSGHNNFRVMWPIDKAKSDEPLWQPVSPNENARTEEQLKRIGNLGGMFGLGSDHVSASEFAIRYVAATRLVGPGRVALGTDLNGLVKGPPPDSSEKIYSAYFPMSETGDRTWDFGKVGVAHYGMLADFIRSMSMQQYGAYFKSDGDIMNNAEYFAKMWEKAVNNSKNVKSLKLPSEK